MAAYGGRDHYETCLSNFYKDKPDKLHRSSPLTSPVSCAWRCLDFWSPCRILSSTRHSLHGQISRPQLLQPACHRTSLSSLPACGEESRLVSCGTPAGSHLETSRVSSWWVEHLQGAVPRQREPWLTPRVTTCEENLDLARCWLALHHSSCDQLALFFLENSRPKWNSSTQDHIWPIYAKTCDRKLVPRLLRGVKYGLFPS